MAKKKSAKKPARETTLAVGDLVRVRPGVVDPDSPDVPLGGWTGTVYEAVEGEPRLIGVEWNQATMQQRHPIFQRRCDLRDLDAGKMYLFESDLTLDDGSPVVLEQPTEIVPLPLSLDDQEDRVRAALG